eukprot:gene10847-3467_t
MNLIREINERNEKELTLGLTTTASWHDKYKESAYIYIGGIDYDLNEGDLVRVFSQYGEVVDINLVRDEETGAPKGFCYLAYEDQRSTNLAVDNFNGIQLGDRIISVDHKLGYFRKVKTNGEEEIPIIEKPHLLRQLEGEIPTEKELEEKRIKKEEKKLRKEEKRRKKEEKKRKREMEDELNYKRIKEEENIQIGPVGPQRPKTHETNNKIEKQETPEEIEQRKKDEERRDKYYSKEFFFDQNINVNPENISNKQHYEQSYLYGLNQPHKLAPTDSRFGYDHLRYYDSLTHKDKEHKEKKQKHKEKIVKKINKF